jgi:hypothetical protein
MSRTIAAVFVVALVLLVFVVFPDNDLTRIEGYNATQVAQNRTIQTRQTALASTPTLTPLPTPKSAVCLLPPSDKVVTITESIPTAWDAFIECFDECVEANGRHIDVTNFEWWLQKNGFESVEDANIVHKGDVFNCYSKPGWLWS